ncbi:hypothetical protein GCM10010387_13520 [Streptomyces inusitatus]|uniref:Uncharacterized protein n=1 Tax=Streptomyces inusitatus TaxID=68221 RepID=A0A918PST3_9ACTN|nr:hypothetical protein GCM10010387_13520 [Streptomyces inusitatus]
MDMDGELGELGAEGLALGLSPSAVDGVSPPQAVRAVMRAAVAHAHRIGARAPRILFTVPPVRTYDDELMITLKVSGRVLNRLWGKVRCQWGFLC